MKKFVTLLLVMVMILSMAATASAASITITPPTLPEDAVETGITYEAYKIFDATISGNSVAYTIESTSPYFETIKGATEYFTLTQSAGSTTTYVVKATEAYTKDAADTFAETLKAVEADAVGTLAKQTDGTYKLGDLADGYYLVTSSVGSDLILETIGDVTATTKNEYPSLKKEVEESDSATAYMGEILDFTITVSIPKNAAGEIVVHDKMTGLEYQSMTAVDGITVTTTGLTDECAVHFTLTAEYVAANKGKDVEIKYTAKVTADIANNEAWLVDDTFTSTPDKTDVYNTDIVISKIDGQNKETKLEGAKFVLKNEAGKFYKLNGEEVTWVDNQEDATVVTTDANGAATFASVGDGNYSLIETEAPAGYNLVTDPIPVIVAAGNVSASMTVEVENNAGTLLPSTGGMGTTMFYVIGGLMMLMAVVLLVTKKRMASAE